MNCEVKKSYNFIGMHVSFEQALSAITEYFNYDKDKALAFYMRKNEMFGGVSPYEMVKAGKGRQLLRILARCQMQ